MKKFLCTLLLFLISALSAETGQAAAASAHSATTSNWKSWAFAGSGLVAMIVGVAVVVTNHH